MDSRLGMVSEDTYCPEPIASLGGNCILPDIGGQQGDTSCPSIYDKPSVKERKQTNKMRGPLIFLKLILKKAANFSLRGLVPGSQVDGCKRVTKGPMIILSLKKSNTQTSRVERLSVYQTVRKKTPTEG